MSQRSASAAGDATAATASTAAHSAIVASTTTEVAPVTATVGVVRASALYIAAVLGTGILVLPAVAATKAGPASILSVVAVLLLSIPLAGTFAVLASRFPDSGGVASYVRRALGPTAARMAGYWFFFGVCVGTPVVATLGASYVVSIFGGSKTVVVIVAILILVPPFVSNAFGLRVSGVVQLVLTGALVGITVLVIALASPAADATNFEPFMPHGWAGVGAAVSLFVWAFAGWETVTHIAGEFRDPRRTIPLATGIAIVVVGASYLALQVVTIAVLGERAGESAVPLVALVATTAPGVGPAIVAAIAAVVALGVLNAYLGAFAKLGAALGRDGDLPRWLAKGAESGGIPRRSLVIVAVLAAGYLGALVLNDLELTPFILIHTSCMVAVYALGMVAAVRLLDRLSAGWWLAVTSVVLVAGLVLLAGPSLFVPALLAVAALIVTLVKRNTA
jgi:amino acid efflux transporter